MKVPLSWLSDYVDIDDIAIEELAHQMTMAGLEVEEVHFAGVQPPPGEKHEFKVTGMGWDPEKLVVAEVLEVEPHPNADRLVLCRLNDGQQEHSVLTGAPNLFEFKGKGALEKPLKMAYAKEGAEIYDGHQPGFVLTKLKRAKIRGVESYSMICSEKELGISEEHEGVLVLPEDAPVGTPLADYIGDAVLDVAITPNIARNANVLGVAREVAAIFKRKLRQPNYDFLAEGDPIAGQVSLKIEEPELNRRFVVGLIKDVTIKPSPFWTQHRLKLAGQRPINNIVDVTNYVMFDIGQPLHAFDYDALVKRAKGKAPTIITRAAKPGEKLVTLDGIERPLEEITVLVCDTAGAHSIAGIMGGAETEVSDETKNVLLEGANWNYINIRRSLGYLRMHSEASYRFSRGVHPALAERGVFLGLEMMRTSSGGVVCAGLVDEYPLPPEDIIVELTPEDVTRSLGVKLSAKEIGAILKRLEFGVTVKGKKITAKAPDHRLDIDADPVTGRADLMEEIARIYGYENIPETRMTDVLPPQRGTPMLDFEEKLRDLLVRLGLQEIITYRLTSEEREARRLPPESERDETPYIELRNPIAVDRNVMRKSLLASVLEIVESNARFRERLAFFEIGHIYLSSEQGELPDELPRLTIAISGPRQDQAWQAADTGLMDLFDLKGILEQLFEGLGLEGIEFQNSEYPSFHPGKAAAMLAGEVHVGVMGELHPAVQARHDLPGGPVLAAILYLDALYNATSERNVVAAVSPYPPVLEDLALIVDESLPAGKVEAMIAQTGGATVTGVRLFDVYRGEQLGAGKKSLAYSLTYQAGNRTLTDEEVAKVRTKIVKRLARELGAQLRDS